MSFNSQKATLGEGLLGVSGTETMDGWFPLQSNNSRSDQWQAAGTIHNVQPIILIAKALTRMVHHVIQKYPVRGPDDLRIASINWPVNSRKPESIDVSRRHRRLQAVSLVNLAPFRYIHTDE